MYHGWAHKTLNVSSKLRATEKALVKLFIKQSKKTSKQEKIAGKYTIEAEGGTVVEEVNDDAYLKQIIMRLT